MKAIKYTLKIEIEALSPDCFYGQLMDLTRQINLFTSGKLVAGDGDTIKWETETEKVNI